MAESPEELMAKGNELLARARGQALDWANDALHRLSPEGRMMAKRRAERRQAAFLRLAKRLIVALAAVLVATAGIGLIMGPIGLGGLMLFLLACVLVTSAVIVWSTSQEKAEPQQFAAQVDLPALPARTERWLERQRPALPAPAQRQLDQLSLSLEALAPQLQSLDPREPAAVEVRRLVGEELPELIRGYQKVPEKLRREPLHGGATPDRQLTEGLKLIDEEIGRMNHKLAAGDLHALATQNRFLELKYRGDGELEGR